MSGRALNIGADSLDGVLLAEIISQHHQDTQRLLDCLQRENNALLANDFAALETICPEKLALVEKLQTLGDRLNQQLQGIALETYVVHQPSLQSLLPAWRQLLDLAMRCENLNKANGKLLEQRQQQVRRVIGDLYAPLDGTGTYSRSGLSNFHPQSRIIASA